MNSFQTCMCNRTVKVNCYTGLHNSRATPKMHHKMPTFFTLMLIKRHLLNITEDTPTVTRSSPPSLHHISPSPTTSSHQPLPYHLPSSHQPLHHPPFITPAPPPPPSLHHTSPSPTTLPSSHQPLSHHPPFITPAPPLPPSLHHTSPSSPVPSLQHSS